MVESIFFIKTLLKVKISAHQYHGFEGTLSFVQMQLLFVLLHLLYCHLHFIDTSPFNILFLCFHTATKPFILCCAGGVFPCASQGGGFEDDFCILQGGVVV